MFHKHEFKKDGNVLWCSCGKLHIIECQHQWEETGRENIVDIYTNSHQGWCVFLRCKECGDVKSVSLSGVI